MKIQRNKPDGFEFSFSNKAQQLLKKTAQPGDTASTKESTKAPSSVISKHLPNNEKQSIPPVQSNGTPTIKAQVHITPKEVSEHRQPQHQLMAQPLPSVKILSTKNTPSQLPVEPPINVFTNNVNSTKTIDNTQNLNITTQSTIQNIEAFGKRKLYFDVPADLPSNATKQSKGNNFDARA